MEVIMGANQEPWEYFMNHTTGRRSLNGAVHGIIAFTIDVDEEIYVNGWDLKFVSDKKLHKNKKRQVFLLDVRCVPKSTQNFFSLHRWHIRELCYDPYRKAKIENLMSFNPEKLMSKFKLQYRRFLVLENSTCLIPLVNRLIKYLENDWSLWLQYAIKKKKEWHEQLLFELFLSGRSGG